MLNDLLSSPSCGGDAARRRRTPVLWLVAAALLWGTPLSAGDEGLRLVELCKLMLKNDSSSAAGYGVAFSPDGKTALLGTASMAAGLVLLNAATGEEIRRFPSASPPDLRLFVACSPDGRLGAVGCLEGNIKVWSLADGQQVHSLPIEALPLSVRFSPDARRVAAAGTGGALLIWDVASGTEVSRLQANAVPLADVAWSPDGQQVAGAGWDRTLRIWDVTTGNVARSTPHPDAVWAVDYSPDGRQIATGTGGVLEGVAIDEKYAQSEDNMVRIWDSATGGLIRELKGPRHVVRDLAYSPDGKLLAAGSMDKSLYVWDVATGAAVGRVDGQTWVQSVAWSPDGKWLAAAGGVTRGNEPLLRAAGERLRVFRVEREEDGH